MRNILVFIGIYGIYINEYGLNTLQNHYWTYLEKGRKRLCIMIDIFYLHYLLFAGTTVPEASSPHHSGEFLLQWNKGLLLHA